MTSVDIKGRIKAQQLHIGTKNSFNDLTKLSTFPSLDLLSIPCVSRRHKTLLTFLSAFCQITRKLYLRKIWNCYTVSAIMPLIRWSNFVQVTYIWLFKNASMCAAR